MPIPEFNHDGVLPPFLGNPTGGNRSPYQASVLELVDKFATSPARIRILDGFLSFRATLRSFGVVGGLHWVDGSFVENIDLKRDPNDIDCVTFVEVTDENQEIQISDLTDNAKALHHVDAYFVNSAKVGNQMVESILYWFGLFSHQRDSLLWKGIVAIPFTNDADEDAQKLLERRREDLHVKTPPH